MILLVAIGWMVALPILVVVGLLAASSISRGRGPKSASHDASARAHEFVGGNDLRSRKSEDAPPASRQAAGVGH